MYLQFIFTAGMPASNDSYADDTRGPLMQPAPCGATHDKLTSMPALCNGLRAFDTRFSIGLLPASNGSKVMGVAVVSTASVFDTGAPQSAADH